MQSILNLTKTNKLILATFAFLAVLAFGSGRAHAATLTVSGGCTLDEAITSVNTTTSEPGCSPSGVYGSSDTINIPAGTITLSSDIDMITVPVTVQGAGMNQTTIDGNAGQYSGLSADNTNITIKDLKITAYRTAAIYAQRSNVTLNNIEVDGADVQETTSGSRMYGIYINNFTSDTHTVTADSVYIHGIHATSTNGEGGLFVYMVSQSGGGTTNATLSNTTLDDISAFDGTPMNGFSMAILGSRGTVNSTITNATINDITSNTLVAPFASIAFAESGSATVTTNVYNATITGLRGQTGSGVPVAGIKSAAFYSATAGYNSGDVGTATVNVGNSLFADNLNDGVSSNCSTGDMTSVLGGSGSGVPTITSDDYNISDDATCTSFTGAHDQQNVSNIISTLGPLQNNGGNVPTRALLDGSPAISAGGTVLGVTTDARGIARPGTCPSVGAFQFEGAVCSASTTNAGGANAGAPNTGIGSVSILATAIVGLLGLAALGYAFAKRA